MRYILPNRKYIMAGFASRPSPNLLPVFSPYVSLFTLATLARPFNLHARLSKPASILLQASHSSVKKRTNQSPVVAPVEAWVRCSKVLSVRCCTLGSRHCISHCKRTSSLAGPSYKTGCPPLRKTTKGCLLEKAKCCQREPSTDLTTHPSSRESITSSLMLASSPSNSSHLSAFSSVQSKATTNFSSWASLASSASSTAWRVSCPAMLPRQTPRSRSLPSMIPSLVEVNQAIK